MEDPRVYPPRTADEKTMLLAYLDMYRGTMVWKLRDLTDEQAKWSPVPSGTSLFGLAAHLAMVERWWFTAVMADADEVDFPWSDDDPDADWRGPEGATLADVVALYESECERSRAVTRDIDLDAIMSTRRAKHTRNAREIVVHMIEETARHAGHADIIRELLDGVVGE